MKRIKMLANILRTYYHISYVATAMMDDTIGASEDAYNYYTFEYMTFYFL